MTQAMYTINVEVSEGVAHFAVWTPTKNIPTDYTVKQGDPESARAFLDEVGQMIGLDLKAVSCS